MPRGIVRTVDELGRVVITKEIRRRLQIGDYEPVDIYLKGTTICIDKVYVKCICCGKPENETELKDYRGVLMCPGCHPYTAREDN